MTWTLSNKQMKRLDGTYTNLLRRKQNIHWKQHATLAQIYGNLPRFSNKLSQRLVQFDGHGFRAKVEVVSSIVHWKPPYERDFKDKCHNQTKPILEQANQTNMYRQYITKTNANKHVQTVHNENKCKQNTN